MTESTKTTQQPPAATPPERSGDSGGRRWLIVALVGVIALLVVVAALLLGRETTTEQVPEAAAAPQVAEPEAGAEEADVAPRALAPYEIQYTELDSPTQREFIALDGATLGGPLHLYVGVPEDEAERVDYIELMEGDRVLWRQTTWPFGDKEPVTLDEGRHTVHALVTYTDGEAERTPEATFAVGEGNVAAAPPPPVDQTDPPEPLPAPVGFARDVTGGQGGSVYWVTTLDDSGPGSLREGVRRGEPTWIRFAVSGTIDLEDDVRVGSDLTIDGRDAPVVISGEGLRLDGVENVIIHNLTFKNGGGSSDTDALRIINGTRGVWVDHSTFSDYPDGLIDITRESTDVTVSYNDFSDHAKVMLINGGMDSSDNRPPDEPVRVTIHHNLFDGTFVRNPKARWAWVHLYNNYFRDWGTDGHGSAVHAHTDAEIYSESNIFEADSEQRAIHTTDDTEPRGRVLSEGDVLSGGARIQEYQSDDVFDPYAFYEVTPEPATPALVDEIVAEAGVRR